MPVVLVVLLVLAAGAVVLAEGEALVLALPLTPGALSLIAPVPVDDVVVVLPLGVAVLAVLLPAGEVVVVVVVVVGALVEAVVVPLTPALLLVELEAATPFCQSPWIFTALPT